MRLYKRAQILVADLWACFDGEGYGRFSDIDNITMFAGTFSIFTFLALRAEYGYRLSDPANAAHTRLSPVQPSIGTPHPATEADSQWPPVGAPATGYVVLSCAACTYH